MNGQEMDEDSRSLWLKFSLEDWGRVSKALLFTAGDVRTSIGQSKDQQEAQERVEVMEDYQRLGAYIQHVVMEREAEVRVNE